MSLLFLIYISRATQTLSEEEVKAISEVSAHNNQKLDVTGLLLHVGNYFVQVLEGEDSKISLLLNKIERDPRHTGMRIIYRGHTVRRLFLNWNMGYFNIEHYYELNRLDIEDLKHQVDALFAQKGNSPESLLKVIRIIPELLEAKRVDIPTEPSIEEIDPTFLLQNPDAFLIEV